MSTEALRVESAVITKLRVIYLLLPLLRCAPVSRKTERPYSAMKM
jgi:hypothetical protein